MRALLVSMLLVASPAAAQGACDAERVRDLEARLRTWSDQRLHAARLLEDLRRVVAESRELQDGFTAIARSRCGARSVDALVLVGRVDLELARLLVEAPVPPRLPRDAVDLYRNELELQASPLRDRARETFQVALERADAEHVTSRHVDFARRWLDEHR